MVALLYLDAFEIEFRRALIGTTRFHSGGFSRFLTAEENPDISYRIIYTMRYITFLPRHFDNLNVLYWISKPWNEQD